MTQDEIIRMALAEHDLYDVRCECCGYMTHHREHMGCIRAAYAAPVEPVRQEPVAKYTDIVSDGGLDPRNGAPVRTKDLTDDEIWNDVYDASKHWSGFDDFNVIEFARAVIAADREKNR